MARLSCIESWSDLGKINTFSVLVLDWQSVEPELLGTFSSRRKAYRNSNANPTHLGRPEKSSSGRFIRPESSRKTERQLLKNTPFHKLLELS